MIPITRDSVVKAAKKSKQAALENCIKKYTYFISCSYEEFNAISYRGINNTHCALCERYLNRKNWKCPLGNGFCRNGNCLCNDTEWTKLSGAQDTKDYELFQLYASAILVKLLKLAGKLK